MKPSVSFLSVRFKYSIKYLEQRPSFHTNYPTQFTACLNRSQNNSVYRENMIFKLMPHILIGNMICTDFAYSHLSVHCVSCVILVNLENKFYQTVKFYERYLSRISFTPVFYLDSDLVRCIQFLNINLFKSL